MICVKSKNQKMSFVILFLLLLLLLLLSTTPCHAAAGKARFERFKGGSSASQFKPFNFRGADLQGNSAHKEGDQVFGADKRKVYTGPNPLHNR
ncbi:hypothetical protein PHAVU_001G120900 [Phaseolus vulgaris]|uniref:Uncharacterized protein n=1 Tax=Phaseolus vulgaris TaxID=3885 RepID=V7CV52_PHAVU|nr:hypothetical protein PHAVU_001G120900g [Phaseolus vulgaris]ESW34062.1 hypothetical protein PHAVU_001G120900g [Phaseolus vulgaris]